MSDDPAPDAVPEGAAVSDEVETVPPPEPADDLAPAGVSIDPRWLWGLVIAAVVTRLVWCLWIHPADDYVFSDMKKYVNRAVDLSQHGFRPGIRPLAWQAWGTHYLLALPLWIFGKDALWTAGLVWAGMSAAAVPIGYRLACRIGTRAWIPKAFGVVLLLWYPHVSNAGYFLSETPFLFFQLWSTYRLVLVLQEGRGAWTAGLVSACAFAIRPQAALFFLLVFAAWWINRRRLGQVLPRHLIAVSVPLLAMLAWSLIRFHAHTGYWGGVAENANMNLTAGRCHNIVTQAFKTEAGLERSERAGNTRNGRRVSLPGFRVLAKRIPDHHPLGLRPALGGETIRMVGYIGDPQIHREIRARCYAATGVAGQVRYSIVNLSLLWFVSHQWPEAELKKKQHRHLLLPPLLVFEHGFRILIWLPSLLGIGLALAAIRRNPGLSFCAFQLITSMTVAAVFFGTVRLRMPYDPYAILLALEVWARLLPWARRRLRPGPAASGQKT